MSSAAEKANLARIRDNQRRSRARRKEYLQELEARLRQCELHGIEASAEIQLAARRVADENKKLRALLAQHGIGDDTVDAHLQCPPTSNGMATSQFRSSSGAVQDLEQLLQTRKVYCAEGASCAPSNTRIGEGQESRDSSSSTTTAPSLWDPIHPAQHTNATLRVSGALHQGGKAASSANQFMFPSSTTSRTSSIGVGHSSTLGGRRRQPGASGKLPRYPSPTSNASSHTPQLFDIDPQLAHPSASSYSNSQNQLTAQHHLQPYGTMETSSVYQPITSDTRSQGTNSCIFATDMITTMAGGDPMSIRADLGCLPEMDCEVNHDLVFDVMDRYTGSGAGL